MTIHPTIAAFALAGNSLAVGGIPIERLTAQVGSTPFFAYDRKLLTSRIELLRSILPAGVHLCYAIKANPMPAVVHHLSQLVDAFDVASALEMRTALNTGILSSQVSFAGPGKTVVELSQAIAAGVLVELESAGEARRVIDIGHRIGIRPRVAIRINPDFRIRGSGMRMGGGPQQFGVDAEAVPELLDYLAACDVDFLGFHVFAGSQILDAGLLCEAQRRAVSLVLQIARTLREPLRYLNLGGGFGIPYFPEDTPLDLAQVGANLAMLTEGPIRNGLPEARVVIELGRFVVGECGVYVTRVVDRKQSRGRTYLVVDGGLHHQLAASGNFGQVIRRNYPIAVANRMLQTPDETATVVGCLCTPLDLLGDNVALPRAEVGDPIVLFQAGAYGLTASPVSFLGHPAPVEVLVGERPPATRD